MFGGEMVEHGGRGRPPGIRLLLGPKRVWMIDRQRRDRARLLAVLGIDDDRLYG